MANNRRCMCSNPPVCANRTRTLPDEVGATKSACRLLGWPVSRRAEAQRPAFGFVPWFAFLRRALILRLFVFLDIRLTTLPAAPRRLLVRRTAGSREP